MEDNIFKNPEELAEEEPKKELGKAEVVRVPTEHSLMIQLPNGKTVSDLELLAEIYNELLRIGRNIA